MEDRGSIRLSDPSLPNTVMSPSINSVLGLMCVWENRDNGRQSERRCTVKNMTYDERINEKLNQGISHIQAEIEVTQEDADAKIAALRRRQETEETRIRELMIAVLSEDHPDLFAQVEAKARRRFEDAAEKRRTRPKGAATPASQHNVETEESEEYGDLG